jgi:hypothetical protein
MAKAVTNKSKSRREGNNVTKSRRKGLVTEVVLRRGLRAGEGIGRWRIRMRCNLKPFLFWIIAESSRTNCPTC